MGKISLPGFSEKQDSYIPFLIAFMVLVSPMCLLNFARTRPLQLFIGACRVTAVVLMMAVMLRYLGRQKGVSDRRTFSDIPLWNFSGLPLLYGNAALIFMIHHSI